MLRAHVLAISVIFVLSGVSVRAATADVSITTAGTTVGSVGDDRAYSLRVTNAGPGEATGVEVSDPLADGLVLASVRTDLGSCGTDAPVVCQIGTLGAGQAATVTIVVAALRSGSFSTTGRASSPDDAAPGNDAVTRTLSISGAPCTVVGTIGDDHLVYDSADADVLCGLGGADTIEAGAHDTALGGSGDDILTAIGSGATLNGGAGNDLLHGGPGADLLLGGTGNDVLNGNAGDDHLDGGDGTDTLDGGSGLNACTEAGTACVSTNPNDPADTYGGLEILTVRTVFGRVSTFTIGSQDRWQPASIWDYGYFALAFDMTGGPAVDHRAVVRVERGVLRATMMRVSSGRDVPLFRLTVVKVSATRFRVTVPIARLPRDANRAMYRWAAFSLQLHRSCAAGVCLDGVPSLTGMLPQPLP